MRNGRAGALAQFGNVRAATTRESPSEFYPAHYIELTLCCAFPKHAELRAGDDPDQAESYECVD
jgi:hypothetical protein